MWKAGLCREVCLFDSVRAEQSWLGDQPDEVPRQQHRSAHEHAGTQHLADSRAHSAR